MNEGKVIKVREIGDPILEKKCDLVDINNIDENILDVIADLKATLNFGTGYGIAAPQIGIDKRIIVVGVKKDTCNYDNAQDIPITAMINPSIKIIDNKKNSEYEGCMSVPMVKGKVERHNKIKVKYYTENGKIVEKEIEGFFARLVQHEVDHLDGIVFLEKVSEKGGFATREMLNKYKPKKK